MPRTEKGLPVVSPDTLASIMENYTMRENWGEHLEEVKRRLIVENPELTRFIESQVSIFPRELHDQIFAVVVGTIAILEHQAEADKFNSLYTPQDTSERQ